MVDIYLFGIVVFIFGCFIGSFLNVLIWRLPQEMPATGRSFCPHCKHQLSALDLIPVISFLLFRARCRYCKQKISWRYPLIEAVTGVLFLLSWIVFFDQSIPVVLYDWLILAQLFFIVSVVIIVFVIDLEHYLILDIVVFPSTAALLAMAIVFDILSGSSLQLHSLFINALIGMVAGFLPFYILWVISKGKWIGLGDAKYGLFLGAVFGFPLVYVSFVLACLVGTAVSIPLLLTGKKQMTSKLPFGTFLSVAALLTIWFGTDLVLWYLTLIGLM